MDRPLLGKRKLTRIYGGKFLGLRRSNAQPRDRLLTQAMLKCKPLPPTEVLNRWFRLDPATGKLYWKEKPCDRIHAGAEAGSVANLSSGMRCTVAVPGYKGRFYRYRLVWKIVYGYDPSDAIDHWDRNTLNDTPKNLINGGKSWNGRNKAVTAKTGVRGVIRRGKRWRVSLTHHGKSVYIGTYDTLEEAAAAYECRRLDFKPS